MPRATGASTRERILDVTAELLRSAGLAALTTREIARAAGLTEAALYRHFKSKEDLLSCALAERLPEFIELLKDLPQHAGQGSVHDTLLRVAEAAVPFYRHAMPMLASTFSDPQLLARHRAWAQASGLGPHRANMALAAYLRAEAALGRFPTRLNTDAAAAMVLGACQQRAFFDEFLGRATDADDVAAFAATLVDALLGSALGSAEDAPTGL
jgi:AcrR family transcriptional regulator